MQKRFTIIGGSGFIGSALAKLLLQGGHQVTIVDLSPSRVDGVRSIELDLMVSRPPLECLEGVDAVIHLAGKGIFGRWDADFKKGLMETRVVTVRNTVAAIAEAVIKPKAFICASAVGYYGEGGERELTEDKASGDGYLAEVCRAWEAEAAKVEAYGVRWVSIRTGIVLGKGGGHMGIVLPLFRLGLGGRLGSGKQWFPWVHIDDIAPIYRHAALTESLRGPVNSNAPNPVTNSDFTRALGHAVLRPAILPVPLFAMRLVFGDFADEIFRSQRAIPSKLLASGYRFKYENIVAALGNIVKK